MKIAIIGIGYVGIQLAVAFGRKRDTVAFDLDQKKLGVYRSGSDPTGEVSKAQLADATRLKFTNDAKDLGHCDLYIVAVPTPIDESRNPDLGPVIRASRLVAAAMRPGALVVYESTVFPGATEEVCVPVLENVSGLTWQRDFHVGYSPERINPGDPDHTLSTITKVVSADDNQSLDLLADLYGSVVEAGIHRAPSIRVAEAAKVIENTQRDLNIALVNELAVIFDRLNINTMDVLETAGTKWNFLAFRPGLVGGHCIGVDPYYLTHKAQMVNYHPEVILAGRRINDGMGKFVADKTVKLMIQAGIGVTGTIVNILGVTFKENCRDTRNSQVFQMIQELQDYGLCVNVVDPIADAEEVRQEYGVTLQPLDKLTPALATILAVPHREFCDRGFDWLNGLMDEPKILIDIKSIFREQLCDGNQLIYWSL